MKLMVHPGDTVADRFTILRFLAEGGMGEVYEALDEILGERVALKFLSHRNIGDENVTRRFRREIQLARKVTHPNVCRVYDVYEHEARLPSTQQTYPVTFVTMELLLGPTLEERIHEEGRLTEEQARPMVMQMCGALHAAHQAGIIHRDFKSNNVMLVPVGDGLPERVVVTDFGLARSMIPSDPSRTPLTADSLIMGTADYMSPEQIRGDPVSPKSDIYALGVVLFEMLTAGKPYNAPNPMQLLVKRVSEPPARPRDLVPEISPTWEGGIMQCLAEDPADRPPSVEHVLKSLGVTEKLQTLYPSAHPEEPKEVPWTERPSGEKGSSAASWIATVLILGFALLAWWASHRSTPEETLAGFNPRRVTSAPGLEMDPDFSADGLRIVYSTEQDDGRFQLAIREIGSSESPRLLDTGEGQALEPAWSPDGASIVYHQLPSGGLWRIPVAGGKPPEPVVEQGSRPSFSRDGRFLVFQTDSAPLFSDTAVPADAPSVVAVLDLEKGEVEELTTANRPEGGHGSPMFSADGRFVVFAASRRSLSELWAVEVVPGGEARSLVPIVRTPAAYDPLFSADGSTLFFVSRRREVKGLWRVDLDPQTMEPISVPREVAGIGLSSIRQPSFSKDGRLIFATYLTRSNLWAVETDALGVAVNRPRALTAGNDRYNRPSFSPDGRYLLFDHWKLGIHIDLYRLDPVTGKQQILTRGEATNSHGSWLPDGRIVYSRIDGTGQTTVRLLDPETGEDESLFLLEKGDDWVKVSPDGRQVVFHSSRGGQDLDVWVRDLERGPSWRLTFHPESAGFPTWSSRGDAVAYHVRVGDGAQLWLAPLKNGEPRLLVDAPGSHWPFGFSPDGDKVLFAGRRNGVWNIYWVSIETGEERALTFSPSLTGYLRYPTWSPDGSQVVYEKSETTSDLFLVEGFR